MPEVSIILPCYNAEGYIGDAVKSIIDQSVSDWELIVVDDASKDKSVDIVMSFRDDRIRLLRLEANAGYPVAMNSGIAMASGKYMARMDADDVSDPNRIKLQLETLRRYPDAAFCGVARYRITPGNKLYCDRMKPSSAVVVETWENLLTGNRIFTDPSVMVERTKLQEVGGYRTFQRSGMDVDLWFRLMERYGPCITIVTPLFGKRLEPRSIIFNPSTALINQIPRVLAMQRKSGSLDDVDKFGAPDLNRYMIDGLIKIDSAHNHAFELSIGACCTCILLGDISGALVYWKSMRKAKALHVVVLRLLQKLISRLRHNPYVRFNPN